MAFDLQPPADDQQKQPEFGDLIHHILNWGHNTFNGGGPQTPSMNPSQDQQIPMRGAANPPPISPMGQNALGGVQALHNAPVSNFSPETQATAATAQEQGRADWLKSRGGQERQRDIGIRNRGNGPIGGDYIPGNSPPLDIPSPMQRGGGFSPNIPWTGQGPDVRVPAFTPQIPAQAPEYMSPGQWQNGRRESYTVTGGDNNPRTGTPFTGVPMTQAQQNERFAGNQQLQDNREAILNRQWTESHPMSAGRDWQTRNEMHIAKAQGHPINTAVANMRANEPENTAAFVNAYGPAAGAMAPQHQAGQRVLGQDQLNYKMWEENQKQSTDVFKAQQAHAAQQQFEYDRRRQMIEQEVDKLTPPTGHNSKIDPAGYNQWREQQIKKLMGGTERPVTPMQPPQTPGPQVAQIPDFSPRTSGRGWGGPPQQRGYQPGYQPQQVGQAPVVAQTAAPDEDLETKWKKEEEDKKKTPTWNWDDLNPLNWGARGWGDAAALGGLAAAPRAIRATAPYAKTAFRTWWGGGGAPQIPPNNSGGGGGGGGPPPPAQQQAPIPQQAPPATPPGTQVPPQTAPGTQVPPQTAPGTQVPPQTAPRTQVPPQTAPGDINSLKRIAGQSGGPQRLTAVTANGTSVDLQSIGFGRLHPNGQELITADGNSIAIDAIDSLRGPKGEVVWQKTPGTPGGSNQTATQKPAENAGGAVPAQQGGTPGPTIPADATPAEAAEYNALVESRKGTSVPAPDFQTYRANKQAFQARMANATPIQNGPGAPPPEAPPAAPPTPPTPTGPVIPEGTPKGLAAEYTKYWNMSKEHGLDIRDYDAWRAPQVDKLMRDQKAENAGGKKAPDQIGETGPAGEKAKYDANHYDANEMRSAKNAGSVVSDDVKKISKAMDRAIREGKKDPFEYLSPELRKKVTDDNILGEQRKTDETARANKKSKPASEKPAVEKPATAAKEPKSASVKMMLTKADREALHGLGYDLKEIGGMSPQLGQEIINAKIRKTATTLNAPAPTTPGGIPTEANGPVPAPAATLPASPNVSDVRAKYPDLSPQNASRFLEIHQTRVKQGTPLADAERQAYNMVAKVKSTKGAPGGFVAIPEELGNIRGALSGAGQFAGRVAKGAAVGGALGVGINALTGNETPGEAAVHGAGYMVPGLGQAMFLNDVMEGAGNRPGYQEPNPTPPEVQERFNREQTARLAPLEGAQADAVAEQQRMAIAHQLRSQIPGSMPGSVASNQLSPHMRAAWEEFLRQYQGPR